MPIEIIVGGGIRLARTNSSADAHARQPFV